MIWIRAASIVVLIAVGFYAAAGMLVATAREHCSFYQQVIEPSVFEGPNAFTMTRVECHR